MYSNSGARQGWLTGPLGGALGGLMGGGFNGVNHNQALNNAMLSGQNVNSLIGLQMLNNPGTSLADYSQLQSLAGSQDSYQQNVQDQLVANAMGLNTGKTRPRHDRFEARFRLLPKCEDTWKHEAPKQFFVSKQPSTEADRFGGPKQWVLPKIFDHFVWSASECFTEN